MPALCHGWFCSATAKSPRAGTHRRLEGASLKDVAAGFNGAGTGETLGPQRKKMAGSARPTIFFLDPPEEPVGRAGMQSASGHNKVRSAHPAGRAGAGLLIQSCHQTGIKMWRTLYSPTFPGRTRFAPTGGRGHGVPCPYASLSPALSALGPLAKLKVLPYGTGWKPVPPISCRGDPKGRPYGKNIRLLENWYKVWRSTVAVRWRFIKKKLLQAAAGSSWIKIPWAPSKWYSRSTARAGRRSWVRIKMVAVQAWHGKSCLRYLRAQQAVPL